MMERIIIDTDPGVDDAMAILLAVKAADRLKIEALTTVDGNVGIRQVTDLSLIHIYPGLAAESEAGDKRSPRGGTRLPKSLS